MVNSTSEGVPAPVITCLECRYIRDCWRPDAGEPPTPLPAVALVTSITFLGLVPLCETHRDSAQWEWGAEPVPCLPLPEPGTDLYERTAAMCRAVVYEAAWRIGDV